MSDLYKKVEAMGYTLSVHHDSDIESPREMSDYTSQMISFHRNYQLGDKHDFRTPERFLQSLCYDLDINYDEYSDGVQELLEKIEKSDKLIMLPIYAYEHSGITIRTGAFSDPWDSGQVGWIYETKASIRKEFNAKIVSKKLKEKIIDRLKSEIKEYDVYLTGDFYGFTLKDSEGETVDSCWGFYRTDWKENDMFGCMNVSEEVKQALAEQLDS